MSEVLGGLTVLTVEILDLIFLKDARTLLEQLALEMKLSTCIYWFGRVDEHLRSKGTGVTL